ncbi:MAG: hypothetical protein BZ135_08185 [Methanosphaera sp. rholeuAM6]|nr:MAG: hypothetical protein BZ135_08185 [Methanosphaera sp. rholeuAM6]
MTSEKILTLSYHLRYQGVNVSIRSTMMASIIWNKYKDEFNLKELKEALKCVYVKNKEDIVKYERSFDYVFIFNRNTKNNPADQEHIEVKEQIKTGHIDKSKPAQDTTRETMIRRRLEHKKVVDKSILDDEINKLNSIDYRVYDICKDFSKKIANQRSIRKQKNKSQSVDIPKTIRKNLKVGGHLIDLVTKKPPTHKSRHIFLCDISGSCEWATTWFFSLLTGCHETFDKLTVDAFDHRIIDVTHALDAEYKNSFQVNVGLQSLGLRPRGHSDMTKAFTEFLKKSDLNYHTDVIILTDCRDWTGKRIDGILESATILHQIVVKSRNVYIFNPEHKIRWNTPTSCVRDYQEAGAKVFQTNTLKEFAKVIKEI